MITGLPNDWCYQIRKILNNKIYSNPIFLSDMVDIVNKQLEQKIGINNITYFKLDDYNKTINIRFTYMDLQTSFQTINEIHVASVIEFCMMHKNDIVYAITEQVGKVYSDAFVDMIDNKHNMLISQLSILYGHPVVDNGQFCVTFRLY